jgi:hypothetical protein
MEDGIHSKQNTTTDDKSQNESIKRINCVLLFLIRSSHNIILDKITQISIMNNAIIVDFRNREWAIISNVFWSGKIVMSVVRIGRTKLIHQCFTMFIPQLFNQYLL